MKMSSISLRAFPLGLRDRLWPSYLLLRQFVRAAFQAPGITITLLVGVFPFIGALLEKLPSLSILGLSASALAILAPLLLLSGIIALRSADPETYARVLLAGRPAKEVLFVISSHIDRSCRRTLSATEPVVVLTQNLLIKTKKEDFAGDRDYALSGPERDQIGKFVQQFRRFIHKQHTSLLRIETMKYLAAKELDIPPRRLCDHIFQYSPAIHRDLLQKYLGHWEEILGFRRINSPDDIEPVRNSVVHNSSFVDNTWQRLHFQTQILRNRDLHPYIVQFASTHSSSGSLQTYAKALKFIAETGERNLKDSGGNTDARKRAQGEIASRLHFLHRKQKAHPGFDLHTLLLRVLRIINEKKGTEEATPVEQMLGVLDNLPSGLLGESEVERLCKYISEHNLWQLRELPADLAKSIDADRMSISKYFRSDQGLYKAWFSDVKGAKYIVSHGYSKTVLSVLKHILPEASPSGTRADQGLPRIFFILDQHDKSIDPSFDTRVMEYEFKEDQDLRHRFRNFAAGSEHHLLRLVAAGDAALILLGAECFDEVKHVVHPRGILSGLDSLLANLTNSQVRSLVVVVAESYKYHDSLLPDDVNFFGQHFDRIDLYPPECIHVIVSNDKTYPERWLDIMMSRKQLVDALPSTTASTPLGSPLSPDAGIDLEVTPASPAPTRPPPD